MEESIKKMMAEIEDHMTSLNRLHWDLNRYLRDKEPESAKDITKLTKKLHLFLGKVRRQLKKLGFSQP